MLSTFFNALGIWFQNEGPIKDKPFLPVFVFQKICLVLGSYSIN